MIVDPETYQIPELRIHLNSDELADIDMARWDSEPENFNFSAPRAAEIMNFHINIYNSAQPKEKHKIAHVSPITHWFKITKECTANSRSSALAKLEAFRR